MNCKYHINSKIYKDCCYKKRMHKSSNEILNNDEFYNYFLIKLTNITQKSPTNNEFERICNRILSTLDLNLLKQEILNATIFIQKLQNQLNNLHLKQLEYWTKYIVEFNSFDKENLHTICKDCIRELVEQQQVDRFWFRKIHHSGILTESQLNKLHAESLVTLRNRYYDEIKKKILEITDIFLLVLV
ncbi:9414_t:CDS:2, partial [Gigaspora rosea]